MPSSRKVALAAALGGGVTATGFWAFLIGEAALARRAIGTTDARPPSADGTYGDDLGGEPVRLLVLGDSAAVGYGMNRADATPPAMLGLGLAHILGRPVEVRSLAVVGATTQDVLADQLARVGDAAPDVTVIVIGTNDITHGIAIPASVRQLREVVTRLVDLGSEVVVGTTPDLGTIEPIKQPLRSVARRLSRELARRQHTTVIAAGGRPVPLGALLGEVFSERRDVMFGVDRFHPSETGYANMVSVLLPAAAAAIGGVVARDEARAVVTTSRRWHLPLARRRSAAL